MNTNEIDFYIQLNNINTYFIKYIFVMAYSQWYIKYIVNIIKYVLLLY